MVKTSLRKYYSGFTLIEVMIVVVIIAILAAVALPSYQAYIQKSRRVDARETLMRMSTIQERFFFQNSRYSSNLNDLGGNISPEGWYEIDIECNSDDNCTEFTLIATPVGAQAQDAKCTEFTINQTLRQDAQGSDADNCW